MKPSYFPLFISIFCLTSCASYQQEAWRKAEAEARQVTINCREQHRRQHLTYSQAAECEESKAIPILEKARYPNIDLAYQLFDLKRRLALQLDNHEITPREAEKEYAQFRFQVQQMGDERTMAQESADQQRRQMMVNFGMALMRAGTPPPIVNCHTSYNGDDANTQCQ